MYSRVQRLVGESSRRVAQVGSVGAGAARLLLLALIVLAGGFAVSGGPADAVVPGKNGLVAFTRFVGSDTKIFTMPATGETSQGKGKKPVAAKQLTKGAGYDSHPRWSPDGKKLLFLRDGDIFVVGANGKGAKNLTPSVDTVFGAAWSPDGRQIAFSIGALLTMDADGSNLDLIFEGAGSGVDWSPNGELIAFEAAGMSSLNSQIWVIAPNGLNPTILTDSDLNHFDPRWSPNGARIAFAHNRHIWTIAPDGNGLKQVTKLPGYSYSPAWAPDGKKILFEHNGDLLTVSPNGGKTTQVSSTRKTGFQPDWQSQ